MHEVETGWCFKPLLPPTANKHFNVSFLFLKARAA